MDTSILISQVDSFVNKEVEIKGWVHKKRSSGGIRFLQVRDGTGTIQAVVDKNKIDIESLNNFKQLTLESSIILTGVVRKDHRAPSGFELETNHVSVVQLAKEGFPIVKEDHGIDFLLSQRHLWIRSPKEWAILKIRSRIIQALENMYREEQFTRIDTPIITPNACEGTTTLFELDYFGTPAYLSQSGQLYLEAAIASFRKVYNLAPVFRAEKSKTRRHLIEFWMSDAEIAFLDLSGLIEFQERIIMRILQEILTNDAQYLQVIGRDISLLEQIHPPFERITYNQAIDKLHELGSDIKFGEDLGNDDETILMNHYHQPLFITHYPAAVKAFYMKKDPDDSEKVLCCDLLAPEGYGEIIGGSEREEDYNTLLQRMREENLPTESFRWYLDLRRYGSVPHSGYGIGIERLTAWICGLRHVRRAIPFPRTLQRFKP